jgi:tetratricopeptide (TPR) repeat protein
MVALALYQALSERGVDAFYDLEGIRAGEFEAVLLSQIAARPYFVLVLTPGTLDRCSDESDWVRREIEHAVATKRVIVLAYTPSFDFADFERCLPRELGEQVRRFNGQELHHSVFRLAVRQLAEEFLVPIELASHQPSDAEARAVAQMQRRSEAAAPVTNVELAAEECLARGLARHRTDREGAIADYSEAIRLNPRYAYAFNNRGGARDAIGDIEGAIADYTEAMRLDPDYPLPVYNLAILRAAQGDVDAALAAYAEAIRIDPDYAPPYYNRAVLRMARAELNEAHADLSEAIRLDPKLGDAFFNRGAVRHALRDFPGAVADFSEVMRLNPNDVAAFLKRADTRIVIEDYEGASADVEEALRLDPGNADAQMRRRAVRVFARAKTSRGTA